MGPQKRRRSSIVPDILHGEPQGSGPLRIGAHFVPKGPQHQLMSWEYIQKVVTSDDLDKLLRHPDCENEYVRWAKSIREHYGGLEKYVAKERLGWDLEGLAKLQDPNRFFDDDVLKDLESVKVVFNDWPYGIPTDCKHYVVWCRYQIIAPALFTPEDTPIPAGPIRDAAWQAIMADGIRGVTGARNTSLPILGDKSREIIQKQLDDGAQVAFTPQSSTGLGLAADIAQTSHLWAGRFVHQFIENYWNVEQFESAYFCNPPHLRTVPGLSHFHVIVRKRE